MMFFLRRPRKWEPSCWSTHGVVRADRRTMRRARFIIALSLIGCAVAATAQEATANYPQNPMGGYYLVSPGCCNGDALYGTRAGLSTPVNTISIPAHCFLARSDAEGSGPPRLLQAGFVRCAPGYTLDGTCSVSNNLVHFVERLTQTFGYECWGQGAVSYNTTHKYTSWSQNFQQWYAYRWR